MNSKSFPCDACTFLNAFTAKNCEICGLPMKKNTEQPKFDTALISNVLKAMDTKNKIEKNYEEAYKVIPESFFRIFELYRTI